MIEIEQLSFRYPGAQLPALNNIDMSIDGHCLLGLLGPNGAGKSTLLSMLCGLLPAPHGAVRIDGVDISRSPSKVRRMLSLVPQEYAFYPSLTVGENLRIFAGVQGIQKASRQQRIEEVCQITGLWERLRQRAETLSGGLKRRLNIAIGLLNRPRLLFLDEPTVGIDPQSRRFILEAIKNIHQQGTAIVYTSHYMEEVEYLCDHIAIIDRGRLLLQGSLQQLLRRERAGKLVVALDAELSPQQIIGLQQQGFSCRAKQLAYPVTSSADVYHSLELLRQQAVPIAALSYGSRNLEDLFLQLTKRSLRD